MKSLETWLRESTEKYKLLADKNRNLAEQISNLTPEEILHRCTEIQEIQQKLEEADEKMYAVISFTGPEALNLSEIGEYQRSLEKAIKESDHVASKARLYKQLLQKELTRLQDGNKVVTSYNNISRFYSGSRIHKEL